MQPIDKVAGAQRHAQAGLDLLNARNAAGALAEFDAAVALAPGAGALHYQRARALAQLGRLEEALLASNGALVRDPGMHNAHVQAARFLRQLRRPREARDRLLQALAMQPGLAVAHLNLGNVYQDLREPQAARASYQNALRHDPLHANTHVCIGALLHDQGDFDAAERCYREGLRLQPTHADGRSNLGQLLLARGDMEQGWRYYQARPIQRPTLPFPEWQGESLDGKSILMLPEQGLGDEIQLARYASVLKERGARHVTLMCKKPLLAIFASLPGVDRLQASGAVVEPHDYWAFGFSLPLHCVTTVATVPANIPYLHAESGAIEQARATLAGVTGLKVGLCWKGAAGYARDYERSVGLEPLRPLFQIPGVRFVTLQPDSRAEFLAAAGAAAIDLGHEIDADGPPFKESAALVGELDMVVACDTSLGHLAGALGRPVALLLPKRSDWRWMEGRSDTPWYPATTLFRQEVAGDWSGPIAAVAARLKAAA